MGVITPGNHIQFVSSDTIFGRVAEELSSFNEANQLDEGLYYGWMNDVLTKLGVGYYSEEIAFIKVENYKAKLPKNFKQFYAAYRCTRTSTDANLGGTRGVIERYHYYTDVTSETDCYGQCCVPENAGRETRTSVTVEHYIDTSRFNTTFSDFKLLGLGNTAIYDIADFQSINRSNVGVQDQIAFSRKGFLDVSYTNDYLYLLYYALPVDEKTCKPLVPNIDSVKLAITFYLQYQSLRRIWLNNMNPDVERRMVFLKAEYDDAMGTAYVEVNTPSFQSLVNKIRINKKKLRYLLNNVYEYGG